MAIQSTEVLPDNTLEEFRIEFNKLITDVSGLSLGNTFSTQIIFEGSTDDTFETGISVTDPTADRSIVFPDQSGNVLLDSANINLADSIELQFGTGSDLKIYHDGSHSYIDDAGTGSLLIRSNQIELKKQSSDEKMATFAEDGAITLYHNNVEILATAATGISVAGDVTATDDLNLTSDAAVLSFGENSEVTLTHVHNDGLLLNADNQLQFRDNAINIRSPADGDLDINADDEIELNSTLIDINGNVEISGTLAQVGVATFTARDIHSGGITIANDGTIGSVGDADAIAISSAGVVTFSQTPVFSGDSTFSDDISLTSDGAIINFGVNSEVTLTHVHDVGLTLTHVTAGDNLPIVLQLKSEEDAIIVNEVIASLEFAAGDSDGTDGATVAAGIHAIAEGTFSATANATKLVFTTGVSETAAASATAKATLSSIGDFQVAGDLVVKNGGLIGSASDLDAIAIASNGVVTFSQIPVMPADSIDSDEYINGSIDREHLAADIIDGTKIADNVINSEHYAAASIDEEHLAANSVDSRAYVDGSIDLAHMSVNSVDSDQYVNGSIDLAHMSVNSVDSDQYVDGSIDTAHIADNQVTLAKMAGGTDGNIISYDASGDPAFVATGTDGQVLTSAGSGAPPVFETLVAFPSGTRMVFQQTAAPTGWTKDTTAALNDGSLRTTTGTVGTGGTVAFETAFASQAVGGTNGNTGATTLSTAQLPSHTHTHGAPNQTAGLQGGQQGRVGNNAGSNTGATGGGGSHTHAGATFSGTAIDLNVKFYDVIIAAKD